MNKIKELFKQYREVLIYLVFGVLTTLVGWVVYYAVMLVGRTMLGIPAEEVTGGRYLALYTVAQIVQWVCAVLFAFFTNRKWVFTDADRSVPVPLQLATFAASRLLTLGLDYGITYGGTVALAALFPELTSVMLGGQPRNLAEILSKLLAAVIVVVCNYIISKLLVFRRKRGGTDT